MKPQDFKYTYLSFDQRRTDMTTDGSVYKPVVHDRPWVDAIGAVGGFMAFVIAVIALCVILGG